MRVERHYLISRPTRTSFCLNTLHVFFCINNSFGGMVLWVVGKSENDLKLRMGILLACHSSYDSFLVLRRWATYGSWLMSISTWWPLAFSTCFSPPLVQSLNLTPPYSLGVPISVLPPVTIHSYLHVSWHFFVRREVVTGWVCCASSEWVQVGRFEWRRPRSLRVSRILTRQVSVTSDLTFI